jgi:ABC-type glycerol-3-phosphate transport system permease component
LIDGYGRFGSFIKIALPLARPGMIAVMVFTFLGAWQEFILAQTFITQTAVSNYTLPLLFQNFQRIDAPDIPVFYELLSAYSIIVALPVVIFYLLLQKQLMGGAIAGGIK